MVTFELPDEMTEEFVALIPQQRYVINNLLLEGKIRSYSLSADRLHLWAVLIAESEFEVMEILTQMPLIDYMTPTVTELMFHNSAERVLQFSLN